MPDLLPDIETTDVGQIAWWNALDHDASFLDPAELLSYSGVENFTGYDNGVTGTLSRDHRLRFRAKTDGWIVVYYDTSIDPVTDYTFIEGVQSGYVNIHENVLAQEIDALRLEASNSEAMDFNYPDVGFYDYTNPEVKRLEAFQHTPGSFDRWGYREGSEPDRLYLTGRSELTVNGASVTPITWNDWTLVEQQVDEGVSDGFVEGVAEGWLDGHGEIHFMRGGETDTQFAEVAAGILAFYE